LGDFDHHFWQKHGDFLVSFFRVRVAVVRVKIADIFRTFLGENYFFFITALTRGGLLILGTGVDLIISFFGNVST
jgi:hypothetical protein